MVSRPGLRDNKNPCLKLSTTKLLPQVPAVNEVDEELPPCGNSLRMPKPEEMKAARSHPVTQGFVPRVFRNGLELRLKLVMAMVMGLLAMNAHHH